MIIITMMAPSFNYRYHWRNGTELCLPITALRVNACLDNAVKPIYTFYFHFAEHWTSRLNYHLSWATLGGEVRWAIYPFLLEKKIESKIPSKEYISYIFNTYHIHIKLVVPSRQCLLTYSVLGLNLVYVRKRGPWDLFVYSRVDSRSPCSPWRLHICVVCKTIDANVNWIREKHIFIFGIKMRDAWNAKYTCTDFLHTVTQNKSTHGA